MSTNLDRPGREIGTTVARPSDANLLQLLGGGKSFEGITFTNDQVRALRRLYGIDEQGETAVAYAETAHAEALRKHAEEPQDRWSRRSGPPKPPDLDGIRDLFVAGAERNLMRFVRADGLRLMAVLGRHLEPGQDPVRFLLRLMIEVGFDVPNDVDWAYEDDE